MCENGMYDDGGGKIDGRKINLALNRIFIISKQKKEEKERNDKNVAWWANGKKIYDAKNITTDGATRGCSNKISPQDQNIEIHECARTIDFNENRAKGIAKLKEKYYSMNILSLPSKRERHILTADIYPRTLVRMFMLFIHISNKTYLSNTLLHVMLMLFFFMMRIFTLNIWENSSPWIGKWIEDE